MCYKRLLPVMFFGIPVLQIPLLQTSPPICFTFLSCAFSYSYVFTPSFPVCFPICMFFIPLFQTDPQYFSNDPVK